MIRKLGFFGIIPAQSLRRHLATHAPAPSAVAEKLHATRHDWTKQEIQEIYDTPLLELVFRAASVHRQYHDPNKVQLCTLMNIKSEFKTIQTEHILMDCACILKLVDARRIVSQFA